MNAINVSISRHLSWFRIYICNRRFFSLKKEEGNPNICDKIDESRGHYAK